MTVRCNSCGYDENPDGSEYCEACGFQLIDEGDSSPPTISEETLPPPPPPTSIAMSPTIAADNFSPPGPPPPPKSEYNGTSTSPSEMSPTIAADNFSPPSPPPASDLDDSQTVSAPPPPPLNQIEQDSLETFPPPIPQQATPSPVIGTAKLISKTPDYPIQEFKLDEYNIIGRFDPDSGPVDIDLEGFPGDETISRNHAEIYREGNQWKIKDLGSVNGVFIKHPDEKRFGSKITTPVTINSGDEISIAKIRFVFEYS